MSIVVRSHDRNALKTLLEDNFQQTINEIPSSAFVCVGDTIDTDEQDNYLRGHGTQTVDGRLVATVCGVVQRVNKLIYVTPLRTRYNAELGDVVVGRVTEIVAKRWKVDLHSRHEASLLLSAVNLPGSTQRRRNVEDELNMRSVFKEGDLVSAEVQQVNHDGAIALQTRTSKFGKLLDGQLVVVAPNLVKRRKAHFVTLPGIDVDLILGVNGLIWVTTHQASVGDANAPPGTSSSLSRQQRESAARVANAIRALARLHLIISPDSIMGVYNMSVQNAVPVKSMCEPELLALVAMSESLVKQEARMDEG